LRRPWRFCAPCLVSCALSCRVFGNGIERAVMNHIKRAVRRNGEPIVSRLVVIAHNAPCHDFLPQNGFARDGDAFVFSGTDGAADPPGLAIEAVAAPAA
jgi:hypothetical protein